MQTILSHTLAVKLFLDGLSCSILASFKFWSLSPFRDWFRALRMRFMPTGQQDNDRLMTEYREGRL